MLQSLVFLLLMEALAARLPRLQKSGNARRLLRGLGGALFIALALRLLGERPAAA